MHQIPQRRPQPQEEEEKEDLQALDDMINNLPRAERHEEEVRQRRPANHRNPHR